MAQHIGFLTFAGMARVVKGNHGNDQGKQEFCVYLSLVKLDYNLHFDFYERKQNKCVHVL